MLHRSSYGAGRRVAGLQAQGQVGERELSLVPRVAIAPEVVLLCMGEEGRRRDIWPVCEDSIMLAGERGF